MCGGVGVVCQGDLVDVQAICLKDADWEELSHTGGGREGREAAHERTHANERKHHLDE